MQQPRTTDSLGDRILSAARLAVEAHLAMDAAECLQKSPRKVQAMVGGTDRRVTDDPIPMSVVSGPSSVVDPKQMTTDN